MKGKIPCSTGRDLLAKEKVGLSPQVQEHLNTCSDCRQACQDIASSEAGKVNVPDNYPPIPLIQKGPRYLRRFKFLIAGLVVLAAMGLFWHNYSQPLVVEERHYFDMALNQYVVSGTWDKIRGEQVSIKGYDYYGSVEELIRAANFRVYQGYGKYRNTLSGEDAMAWLEKRDYFMGISVSIDTHTYTKLARTGWLVWHQAEQKEVLMSLAVSSGGASGTGSSGVTISFEQDPDYNNLPHIFKEGHAKHSRFIPAGISRPGVKGE